jgi:phosphatidate cytidylyltransferase
VRNLGLRLIVWFIGVPGLVAIVLLLPFQNHLVLNLVVVSMSALGAAELASMFERKDAKYKASFVIIPLLGGSIPAAHLLVVTFQLPELVPYMAIVAVIGAILFVQIFRHTADDFRHTLTNVAANVTVVVYPGLFLSFIIRFNEFAHSSGLILVFLCSVFFNDTMAYLAGGAYRLIRVAIAKRNGRDWSPRVVLPVSPKKTVAGFIGGFVMAPIVLVAADRIFPEIIPGGWQAALVVGALVGVATIVGDLIESAIKRSATSKDSGALIPGRGGILDSVDSVLYAAPVFYYLLLYLS